LSPGRTNNIGSRIGKREAEQIAALGDADHSIDARSPSSIGQLAAAGSDDIQSPVYGAAEPFDRLDADGGCDSIEQPFQ
jgi:hypothetical protein